MTLFFIMFFLVVTFWEERVLVLAIVCSLGVIASVVFALFARQMILNRPKFLSQTLTELKRDIEGLKPVHKTTETKL